VGDRDRERAFCELPERPIRAILRLFQISVV